MALQSPAYRGEGCFGVRQRGATLRQPAAAQQKQVRVGWLKRLVTPAMLARAGALCVTLATLLVGVHLGERVMQSPLRGFVIEGELRRLEKGLVNEALAPYLGREFATLPLQEVRSVLAAMPWIAGVELKRDWPDTLVLSLEEEEPVARWGGAVLINSAGDLFEPRHRRGLDGLPLLEGPRGTHGEVMARFTQFSGIVERAGLVSHSLRVSERGSWRLGLDNGVELVIGEHRLVERLQRFNALYERLLMRYLPDIERIDLRYQHGVAVQWRSGRGPGSAGGRTQQAGNNG